MLKNMGVSLFGLSTLLMPLALSIPANAQTGTSEAEQYCELAIRRADNILVSNRNLWMTKLNVGHAEEVYQNYPYQHPMTIYITVAGNDSGAVMNSPQLLTTITRTIMDGCPGVGLVGFAVSETDWSTEFGLIGNQIREFQCVQPRHSSYEGKQQWGYTICL